MTTTYLTATLMHHDDLLSTRGFDARGPFVQITARSTDVRSPPATSPMLSTRGLAWRGSFRVRQTFEGTTARSDSVPIFDFEQF